jgi:diguanylate cyclase (GGDEF)-like protein
VSQAAWRMNDEHRPTIDAGAPPRVLVVGDEGLAALAAEAMRELGIVTQEECIVSVPTFLMALGEAWRHPPQVVLTRLQSLDPTDAGMPVLRSMVSSLRRLAPEARVLVAASTDREDLAVRAMSAGVDDYLLEPAGRGDLARLLAPALGVTLRSTATPDDTPQSGEKQTELDDDGELGDVDLIERLLDGRRGLQRLAVQLVAQRSGIPGVAWAASPGEVPPQHHACPIALRGQSYGLLHAPDIAPDTSAAEELASWAAWLARWLALEARIAAMQKLAYRDELTGVWNRRYFNQFLEQAINEASQSRKQVTLLVFDIDDFKIYNDRFGHGAGDDILRETARLMQSVVRTHDVVARIGGDEFAVIFWDPDPQSSPRKEGSTHPTDVLKCAHRFQKEICAYKFPKLIDAVSSTVTISGGLASFPWDGRTPADLLDQADQMALRSKQQGKNAITFGPGATRICVPDDAG